MTSSKNQTLQDVFLNQIRKERVLVTIFLRNGVRLQGYIVAFDNFSILFKRDNQQQLVYKHAISTVMPASLVTLMDDESKG